MGTMHSFDDLHDVTLVDRSQAGDLAALELLVRRYQRVLFTVALRMLGDARTAQAATRAALVRTHALLAMRDSSYGFFHAAHRLLIDECLDVVRHHRPSPARGSSAPGAAADAGAGADRVAEDSAEVGADDGAVRFGRLTFDERRHRMHDALLQLLPELRAVVILRHVAGLSYDETAITLDFSRETVRFRLHMARHQLGERLMGWSPQYALPAADEALLQDAIDGELDYRAREARDHLLGEHPDAHARAAALRDLGHLLNSLGPAEPPSDLASHVLAQINGVGRPH
jgi:RNA polymerase sigma-70 factor (ECF subfamily)